MQTSADLREKERSRLLRRVDWRFLLPDPLPRRSVSFAGSRLGRALDAVLPEVVKQPAPGSCDLAVASRPDRRTLSAAREALRPGGALYVEWPLSVGATALRERLKRAGFDQVEVYRPWPWPELLPARFWLPADDPRAASYARGNPLLHAHPNPGPGIRALRWAYRTLDVLGIRRPLCSLAFVPGPAARERPCQLLISSGARSVSKVVALVFGTPESTPSVVMKHARGSEGAQGLAREREVLHRLPRLAGVPQLIDTTGMADASILVETAMPGRPLWAELDSRSYDELARLGTSWLIAFGNATKKPAADVTPLATRLLGEFQARFGACFDDATMRGAERVLSDIGPLPRVSEQRDFGPWNLLLSAQRSFGVLDWESAELEGLPAADLTYFLSYLAFFELRALRNGRFVDIHRLSLDPSTRWGSTRERCLLQYADGMGIDLRALRHIPLLTWMIHSRSEYRRLVEDVGPDPGLEALRKCVFPRLWELELRKVLQA